MTEWPEVAAGVAVSAFYLGLAAIILRARPRGRPSLALAGYCLMFAALLAWSAATRWGVPASPSVPVGLAFELASYFFLFLLGLWLPRPAKGPGIFRRPVAMAAGLAVVIMGVSGAIAGLTFGRQPTEAGELKTAIALPIEFGAVWFLFALLAMRFAFAPGASARDRRQAAVLTFALCLFDAAWAGAGLAHPEADWRELRLLQVGLFVALAGAWLAIAHRSATADARLARTIAWALLLAPLVSAVASIPLGFGWLFRPAQALSVVVLTYGILRHQLLGIDLKVKWTIRQSTVAAAFIGVFFVVSESASTFFAASGLGPYLGIAAAGLLVFAIAPLQRAAGRVASAAMPGVRSPREMSPDERAAAYHELARVAWEDGSLSADERRMLEAARAKFELSREDAHRIEAEAGP